MGYNKYTKEILENVILVSTSWTETCLNLGVKPMTGAQTHIKKRAIFFNVNFSHFIGQAYNRGNHIPKKEITEYFKICQVSSHSLKNRLINEGYKKKECEICKSTKWNDVDIPLELDHIDSNHFNNNLENLQIICPNCHALVTRERRILKKKPIKKPIKKRLQKYKKPNKYNSIEEYRIGSRKVKNRPSLEILEKQISELGYCATGRLYDVSDNCIKKWIKLYKKHNGDVV